MTRKTFLLLCASLFVQSRVSLLAAQNIVSLDDVCQAGLRVVSITTVGGEEPEGTIVVKPGTDDNMNIASANKVGCQIVVTQGPDTLYDSGPYVKDAQGATIRINGNTSAFYSNPLNMPYKLKLEKKSDLLTRGDEQHYEDKNWRLLKDATSMNTITGLKLSRLVGMEWTPAYVPCNVVINGDYRGCYLLVETVRRNPRCRINCDKQTGIIVERDAYWWKENSWFSSAWYDGSSMYRWTWKYPDEDDVTAQQELYAQQYINAAEQSLADGSYDNYFDLGSVARWLLAHDILGTRDSGGANMYFKKQDDGDSTHLQMPCLWDFGSSYDLAPGSFSRPHTSSNAYFSRMMQSTNRSFARAYVMLWDELKDSLIDSLTAFVSHYPNTEEGMTLAASRQLNNRRWGTSAPTVESDARFTLQWLQDHIGPLDQQIQLIDIADAGVCFVNDSQGGREEQYYDLHGVRAKGTSRCPIAICRKGKGQVIKLAGKGNHYR